MQNDTSVPPAYDTRPVEATSWRYIRLGLIAWSGMSVLRFAGTLSAGHLRGLLFVPQLFELAASIALLMGACAAVTRSTRSTGLIIGAGSLVLYVALTTWFGGSVRGGAYGSSFLAVLQHVWFPILLVVMKLRVYDPESHPDEALARAASMRLLLASQVPGLAGMLLVVAALSGMIRSDPFGATLAVILILTVCGSILSGALSMAFVHSERGKAARVWVAVHLVYLVAVAVALAASFVMYQGQAHGHPGGGF